MKHFLSSIVVALCLCVGVAYAANDYNLTPEIASAYFEVVDGLAAENDLYLLKAGEAMDVDGYENVFWDARLVDFDGDKVPELFFIYDPEGVYENDKLSPTIQYQVWGWNGHDAYQIANEKPWERVNGISALSTLQLKGILYEDGKAYVPFMTQPYDMSGVDIVTFYTLQNGQWVSIPEKYMYAEANYEANGQQFKNVTIGGKAATSQQYEQRCNEINRNIADVWNTGLDYYETIEKYIQFANQVNMPLTVTSNVDTVQIDGKPINLQVYNVGDRNYVRLRDLAAAMKNTKKQFDVQWKPNMIMVVRNTAYTGKITTPTVQTRTARRAVPLVHFMSQDQYKQLINSGVVLSEMFYTSIRSLNINNENYVLLRDIGRYVDFSVDWDSATSTVVIDTSREYSE